MGKNVQFVVSVVRRSTPDSFDVKVGLDSVGCVFKIRSGDPTYKNDQEHHERWVYETDVACSLDTEDDRPGHTPTSYEKRSDAVFAVLKVCALFGAE